MALPTPSIARPLTRGLSWPLSYGETRGLSWGALGGNTIPAWVLSGSSLALDFANSRYWDGSLDTIGNIVSITRAGSAYAWNQAGAFTLFPANTIRITDNGLLVENATTQVVQRNTDLTNAAWAKNNLTITIGQPSPDASNATANLLDNGAATGLHNAVAANFAFTSGTTYVGSCYAKAVTNSLLQLSFSVTSFGATSVANFNLATGLVSVQGATLAAAGIIYIGAGWYRCYIVAVATATASSAALAVTRIPLESSGKNPSFAGDSTTLLVWMPQTEVGSYPTSPVPNAASASATRAADNITVTGTAAATAIYASQSAYSDTNLTHFSTTNVVCSINAALLQSTSNTQMQTSNGTDVATATIGSSQTINANEIVTAYSFDGVNLTCVANNGTKATTAAAWGATSGTITIGNRAALDQAVKGYIKYLAFSATGSNFDSVVQVPSLYFGNIATRPRTETTFSTVPDGFQQTMTASNYQAADTLSTLSVVVANWAVASSTESGGPSTLTVRASIEYPLNSGNFTQFTWGSLVSGTIPTAKSRASDILALPITIPVGAWFSIRLWKSWGTAQVAYISRPLDTTFMNEAWAGGLTVTDQTLGGTITSTNIDRSDRVQGLVAMTRVPSTFIFGDSKDVGAHDTADATGLLGELERLIGQAATGGGFINAALNADTVHAAITNYTMRSQLALYCSQTAGNYTINDIFVLGLNRTAVQCEGDLQTLWALIKPLVIDQRVFQSVCGPYTTSNDLTPIDATTESRRLAVDAWLRAGGLGLTGITEVDMALDADQNGLWDNIAWTDDGLHEVRIGNLQIASALLSFVPTLVARG